MKREFHLPNARLSVIVVIASLFAACSQFTLYDKFSSIDKNQSSNNLVISPASALVTTGTTVTFTASGGSAPYAFEVVSGGGTVNSTTGVYSSPVTVGNAVVRLSDATGAAVNAAVIVIAAGGSARLAISPQTVSVSLGSNLTFAASGGTPPYSYAITQGAGSIDPITGVYATPASTGSATISVADSAFSVRSADVQIVALGGGLAITPMSGVIGANTSLTFTGFNGVPPYTFSIVAGAGTINGSSGVYHAPGTAGTATVRLADNVGSTSETAVTIIAPPSTVAIRPVAPAVSVGGTVNFTASGGSPPYSFSVLGGGAGGSVNAISGAYVAPISPGNDTVRVTDAFGGISNGEVTVVAASQLVISPSTLTISAGNTYQFGASGGVVPYIFTLFSGAGSVNGGGLYTAAAVSSTDIVRVTDNVGSTSDAAISVVSAGPLAISPTSAAVPEGGTITFAGSGGSPSYIFSVSAGTGSIGAYSGTYTATGSVGASAATVKISDATSFSVTATVDVVPAAPSSLVATAVGTHEIDLTWTNNSSAAGGVVIERKEGSNGTYGIVTTVGPAVNSYQDNPSSPALSPKTLYVYRVRAVAGPLDSPYSNEAFDVTL